MTRDHVTLVRERTLFSASLVLEAEGNLVDTDSSRLQARANLHAFLGLAEKGSVCRVQVSMDS